MSEKDYDEIDRLRRYCFSEVNLRTAMRDWKLNSNLVSAIKYIAKAGIEDYAVKNLEKAKRLIDFEIEALLRENKGE